MSVLRSRWFIGVIASLVFALWSALFVYTLSIERGRLRDELRKDVLQDASNVLSRLESELNSNLYLATGLIGYVAAHRDLEPARVKVALATLFRHGRHLRNVGMAPGNRIAYVHPVVGNEKAIGLYYPDLPQQWPTVKRAIDERRTVLAGPVSLVQGGTGLISRTPVFLDGGEYWGIVSLVIDADSLFRQAWLAPEVDGVRYALRGRDGKGAQGEVFLGDSALFAADAVTLTVRVPAGEWQLAAAPAAGWGSNQGHLPALYVAAFALAGLMAMLTYLMGAERAKNQLLALHDSLTGLPNLRLLNERLASQLAVSERAKRGFALLFLDLDNFKPVNDTLGHREGDNVLKEVARRLHDSLRRSDTAARVGGDEFVVLLPEIHGDDSVEALAQKLLATIADPIALPRGARCRLSVSIGISVYPRDGASPDELIRAADHAMYKAKEAGKNRVAFASKLSLQASLPF